MGYSTGSHTIFHHRYHIVRAPQYRYKVLQGEVGIRVRDIIRPVCVELERLQPLRVNLPASAGTSFIALVALVTPTGIEPVFQP